MEEKKCKLCLRVLLDDFQIVGSLEEQLYDLLLKLKLDIPKETITCCECMENLQASLTFVSNFLYMRGHTNIDVEVELHQSYDTSNMDSVEPRAEKKCHFCTNSAEGALVSLTESKENMLLVDILQRHIPQLDLHNTQELFTCQTCLGPLQNLLVIINCLDAEQTLEGCNEIDEIGMENNDLLRLKTVQFIFEPTLEYDIECSGVNKIIKKCDDIEQVPVIKVEIKVNDEKDNEEFFVKTEEIEIKSEQNDYESCRDTSAEVSVDHEKPCPLQLKMCSFSASSKADLEEYHLNNETQNLSTYKCQMCTYETKYKDYFNSHMLTFKHNKHKCEICSYETNYSILIYKHMLIHKSASEIIWYKCKICTFETIVRNYLDRHMLTHKDTPEVTLPDDKPLEKTVYTCEICTYETKYKRNLNRHTLSHKNPSEVPMYACETCTYETKYERYLKQHLLTHKNTSDMAVYKCEICTHKTKYKRGIIRHMKTHKDPSQIPLFKCEMCTFETKLSKYLDRHMLTHKKDTSDLTLYKCGICTFEAKQKKHLVRHMLTHRSPSELTMHKCDICSYETKYKLNLSRHMLTHQKHKRYLIRQMSIHQNATDNCL